MITIQAVTYYTPSSLISGSCTKKKSGLCLISFSLVGEGGLLIVHFCFVFSFLFIFPCYDYFYDSIICIMIIVVVVAAAVAAAAIVVDVSVVVMLA